MADRFLDMMDEIEGRELVFFCPHTIRGQYRCKICKAIWNLNAPDKYMPDGSWSLVSETCGQCCDNVYMGEQIEKIVEAVFSNDVYMEVTTPGSIIPGDILELKPIDKAEEDATTAAIDKFLEAVNAIKQSGPSPDVMIMHPEAWKDIQSLGVEQGKQIADWKDQQIYDLLMKDATVLNSIEPHKNSKSAGTICDDDAPVVPGYPHC